MISSWLRCLVLVAFDTYIHWSAASPILTENQPVDGFVGGSSVDGWWNLLLAHGGRSLRVHCTVEQVCVCWSNKWSKRIGLEKKLSKTTWSLSPPLSSASSLIPSKSSSELFPSILPESSSESPNIALYSWIDTLSGCTILCSLRKAKFSVFTKADLKVYKANDVAKCSENYSKTFISIKVKDRDKFQRISQHCLHCNWPLAVDSCRSPNEIRVPLSQPRETFLMRSTRNSSWSWSSWLSEKFMPEEGCSRLGEWEARWVSWDIVELAWSVGGAEGWGSMCWVPCLFSWSCSKILSAKKSLFWWWQDYMPRPNESRNSLGGLEVHWVKGLWDSDL